MYNFKSLNLREEILVNLNNAGFINPTPIQWEAIPIIQNGSDLLAIAQTGTGKTGAFCIPVINNLLINHQHKKKREPRVLVIAPTRELCSQINDVIKKFINKTTISSCTVYGGVNQSQQIIHLENGAEIVVATPGRLIDLFKQKLIKLSSIETFILDEADKMLDMGFIDDIEMIDGQLPLKKQTLLFSATVPVEIEKLAKRILSNPKRIEVAPQGTINQSIEQKVFYCKSIEKFQLLKKIVKEEKIERVLVFTQKKSDADNISQYLANNRIASKTFHGDMKQVDRENALQLFRDGSIKILIATNIASRGIDVDGISHVINFDIPNEAENYIHRVGRTGRSGKMGLALSFCDPSEKTKLDNIQQTINHKIKVEKFQGKPENLNLRPTGIRKVIPPTPGKSQEKTAYLDHSKRQKPLKEGEKRIHPGLRNVKKNKRK